MRTGFLGALGVWLAGVGLAFAQPAPEYRPAVGFYHPMAPAVYAPAAGMPQQQPGIVYSQSMYQPGYPMQGYPQAYPQAYPQGYPQPMYYPQQAMVRPMVPGTMPAQWVQPVGMPPVAPQAAPYTSAGPVLVPNRAPAMPLAEDAAPAAPALPSVEAVKPVPAAEPETAAPPMLPPTAGPITSAPAVPQAPVVVEHGPVVADHEAVSEAVVERKEQKPTSMMAWLKAKKDKKADKNEASCDDNCNSCGTKNEKKKHSLLGKKKDKDAKQEVVVDDDADAVEPAKEKKKLLGWGKKGTKEAYVDDDYETPGCTVAAEACPSRFFWFAVDYLGWVDKKEHIRTPLLTTGPFVLLGDDRLDEDLKNGARLRLGYQLSECWSVESSAFGFMKQNERTVIGSNALGFPPLARSVVDPTTGLSIPIPVAIPGVETGAMSVQASSRLYGGDANGVRTLYCDNHFVISALAGFRYLRLQEGVTIVENSIFLDGAGTESTHDSVNSDNQFYGGQVGLTSGVQLGRFYLGTTAKASVGWTQEVTRSDGAGVLTAAGVSAVQPALLVVPGERSDDGIAYVGETSVEVGCQITSNVSALVGWNFLYWSKVARPGDQFSNVLNRPVQNQDVFSTSFWTQGVTASLGVRF